MEVKMLPEANKWQVKNPGGLGNAIAKPKPTGVLEMR
jgi:hypothetical protein